jgi:hypothetical protein
MEPQINFRIADHLEIVAGGYFGAMGGGLPGYAAFANPMSSTKTEEGKAKNRRVQLVEN